MNNALTLSGSSIDRDARKIAEGVGQYFQSLRGGLNKDGVYKGKLSTTESKGPAIGALHAYGIWGGIQGRSFSVPAVDYRSDENATLKDCDAYGGGQSCQLQLGYSDLFSVPSVTAMDYYSDEDILGLAKVTHSEGVDIFKEERGLLFKQYWYFIGIVFLVNALAYLFLDASFSKILFNLLPTFLVTLAMVLVFTRRG